MAGTPDGNGQAMGNRGRGVASPKPPSVIGSGPAVTPRPEARPLHDTDPVAVSDPRHLRHWWQFWTTYIRLGLLVLAAESLFIIGYCLRTPAGPNRTALLVIGAVTASVGLTAVGFVHRIAIRSWRTQFAMWFTVGAGVTLTISIWLDGGLDSPLAFLLVLPVVCAAVMLSITGVAICASAAVAELAIVVFTDTNRVQSLDDLAAMLALLAGVIALACGTAIGRDRLQKDENELLADLIHLSRTDTLTGCLNHGAFYERLDAEINRALRHKEAVSLLVVDLDLFKAFNDARGHAAGDAALAVVGRTLMAESRGFDSVARVGGDEFAVILPSTSLNNAADIASRAVGTLWHPGGVEITVSVGYASLDFQDPNSKRLFRDADAGLYRAKEEGRARASHKAAGATENLRLASFEPLPALLEADHKRFAESVREAQQATDEALSMLDTLQSTDAVGLGFIDSEFRIIRLNPMLAAINGGTVEEQLGRTIEEVVPEIWPHMKPIYESVFDTGKAVTNIEVVGHTAEDLDRLHYWLSNLYPVDLGGGRNGIGVVVVDVTELKYLELARGELLQSVVGAFAASVELRDPYTAGHQARVATIARSVAGALGLSDLESDSIALAARIHDVGKLAVPAEILTRPGQLTDAEVTVVRQHSRVAYDLLVGVAFPEELRLMILQHHERLDGSGYPDGCVDAQICMGARIIAVADVFEAMATHRPYRVALGAEAARAELERGAGLQYDRAVVRALLDLLDAEAIQLGAA